MTKQKVETMKSGYQNPGLYQGEPVAIGRSGVEYYAFLLDLDVCGKNLGDIVEALCAL